MQLSAGTTKVLSVAAFRASSTFGSLAPYARTSCSFSTRPVPGKINCAYRPCNGVGSHVTETVLACELNVLHSGFVLHHVLFAQSFRCSTLIGVPLDMMSALFPAWQLRKPPSGGVTKFHKSESPPARTQGGRARHALVECGE